MGVASRALSGLYSPTAAQGADSQRREASGMWGGSVGHAGSLFPGLHYSRYGFDAEILRRVGGSQDGRETPSGRANNVGK